MSKGLLTGLLLLVSNVFMTLAWYKHCPFNTSDPAHEKRGLDVGGRRAL